MPFSLLLHGYPTADVPLAHVQGPSLQGMFLHLVREVDPAMGQRLHDDSQYRPYTLSPFGIGEPGQHFQGFWLPRHKRIRSGAPCFVRITLLEDTLFSTFSRYFLSRQEPTFRLGSTEFVVTNVMGKNNGKVSWNNYTPYSDLLGQTGAGHRTITLHFLTPTSFRRGKVDFPLPDPRLVFRSYRKRYEEFAPQIDFLADFDELVEFHTGIRSLYRLETATIRTKKVSLVGFIGRVSYQIDTQAPPDLIAQMNLLADYAFFCGTGRKTTVGMGQTIRIS